MSEELPALPEPAYDWTCDYYEGWHCNSGASAEPIDRYDQISLFTEEQMAAYGAECVRVALERAARLIEDSDVPTFMHGGQSHVDSVLLLSNLAAAIRLGQTS
jgi:hypothetical protein